MGTAEVTHIVKMPSGTPLQNINILAHLNKAGFRSDNSQIAQIQKFVTDVDGQVKMVLEKNSEITPAGTYWIIEIQLPSNFGGSQIYTIQATSNKSLLQSKVVI